MIKGNYIIQIISAGIPNYNSTHDVYVRKFIDKGIYEFGVDSLNGTIRYKLPSFITLREEINNLIYSLKKKDAIINFYLNSRAHYLDIIGIDDASNELIINFKKLNCKGDN